MLNEILILVSHNKTNSDRMLQNALKLYGEAFCGFSKEWQPVLVRAGGKPCVENAPLFVSLTHSESLTLAAVSKKVVGIDAEFRKERDYEAIAKRFFSDIPKNLLDFYQAWTARESYKKAEGCSLPCALRKKEIKNIRYLSLFKGYTVCVYGEGTCFVSVLCG